MAHKKVKNYFLVLTGLFILMIGYLNTAVGKQIKVRSEQRFYRDIAKYQLAVVVLYQRDKSTRGDKPLRRQINSMQTMITSLSKDPTYKEGEVHFFRVNIAKKGLVQIAETYKVKTTPTFLLFDGGKVVKDKAGKIVKLEGFASRAELQNFIKERLQERIEEITEEKAEARKRRLEEARIRSYNRPYYGFGFGYGWPYYGYGYGYGYPYYGYGHYW